VLNLKTAWFWIAVLIAVTGTVNPAYATPVIDQQQPVIDTSVGGMTIGGASAQKLAQTVTAGISGFLTEVRFPVSCDAGSNLVVEIQGLTAAGTPNGTTLTSQTFPGSGLPPFPPAPPSFRSLAFSTPVSFSAGDRFAIVLKSAGTCVVFRGPVGDPYAGGNLYFDVSNPSNWVCQCSVAGERFDLPFQTLVESVCAPPVISGISASPSSLWPPNHKMVDVAVIYTVATSCTVSCTLNVASNEALDAFGDGNTTPDWIVIDPNHVRLRAERAGGGGGRVYSVTSVCTNSAGQASSQAVTVTVPHDQGKGGGH
jgi:hypothetical protein